VDGVKRCCWDGATNRTLLHSDRGIRARRFDFRVRLSAGLIGHNFKWRSISFFYENNSLVNVGYEYNVTLHSQKHGRIPKCNTWVNPLEKQMNITAFPFFLKLFSLKSWISYNNSNNTLLLHNVMYL